jgi:hypothetical protein
VAAQLAHHAQHRQPRAARLELGDDSRDEHDPATTSRRLAVTCERAGSAAAATAAARPRDRAARTASGPQVLQTRLPHRSYSDPCRASSRRCPPVAATYERRHCHITRVRNRLANTGGRAPCRLPYLGSPGAGAPPQGAEARRRRWRPPALRAPPGATPAVLTLRLGIAPRRGSCGRQPVSFDAAWAGSCRAMARRSTVAGSIAWRSAAHGPVAAMSVRSKSEARVRRLCSCARKPPTIGVESNTSWPCGQDSQPTPGYHRRRDLRHEARGEVYWF